MGMNTILILIAGIVMSTIIGTQVAPSIVEGAKVTKVQTETINNQEVIFEAIKRYITIQQEAPKDMDDLFKFNYIDSKVNDNGFGGTYEISVSPITGVVTIITTIDDPKAQEIFLKSFKGISKPSCKVDEDGICVPNKFETKYVIPNNIMHGNALLMTGIPIGSTPPDHNTNKYWYDTSTGEAILKVYDKDIPDWVEVNLGGSSDLNEDKTIEGFEQNLSENGWVKFPNGLIIQWGTKGSYDAVNGNSETINFPRDFPNACFLVNAHTQSSYFNNFSPKTIAISSWNQTSFIRPFYMGRMAWIAIGH